MLRKTACAAAGIILSCAAGYSLSLLARSQILTDLDLRRLQPSPGKQDRLPAGQVRDNGTMVLTFDLPAEAMSIVTREPASSTSESAIHLPRPASVRSVPDVPVRGVPEEEVNEKEANKDRLPVGCEPAFSPVTTPAFAHIGVRCDS